jgi:hypothetical protein
MSLLRSVLVCYADVAVWPFASTLIYGDAQTAQREVLYFSDLVPLTISKTTRLTDGASTRSALSTSRMTISPADGTSSIRSASSPLKTTHVNVAPRRRRFPLGAASNLLTSLADGASAPSRMPSLFQVALKIAMQLSDVFFGLPRQIDDVNLLVGPGDGAAIARPGATLNAVMGCANYFPSLISNDSYLHGRLPSVLALRQAKAIMC